MVLAICAALRVAPDRVAVVGDTPADLAMGRSAGAGRVIGVLTGVGGRAELEPLADVVLGSVGELLEG
jgi:phosphoglycolate phosphatase